MTITTFMIARLSLFKQMRRRRAADKIKIGRQPTIRSIHMTRLSKISEYNYYPTE